MAGMTWLHRSDWHQRGPDFDRQVVREALLADLRDRTRLDPALASSARLRNEPFPTRGRSRPRTAVVWPPIAKLGRHRPGPLHPRVIGLERGWPHPRECEANRFAHADEAGRAL